MPKQLPPRRPAGLCLDNDSFGQSNGNSVHTYTCALPTATHMSQTWYLPPAGSYGNVYLYQNTAYCIDGGASPPRLQARAFARY